MADTSPNRLVWIDLEMTGLDPERHTIIEIATLVTDDNLDLVAEGPNIAVHQPDEALERMGEWCRRHHGESGLTDRVRASDTDLRRAEERTLAFIRDHVPVARVSPLCGNSVHQDRRFLARHMPRLEAHLHYRNIDVSTVKELIRRWYPAAEPFTKHGAHRALDDIRESIAELRHYRRHFFAEEAR